MSAHTDAAVSRPMILAFTDLVGSVGLKTKIGTVAYSRLISSHDALFKQIIATTPEAVILKDTGDGFMARFPSSSTAVSACLRFQYGIHAGDWAPEQVTRLPAKACWGF